MSDSAVDVVPASVDRFDDVAAVLGPREPDAPACWCLSMRLSTAERRTLTPQAHRARLRRFAEEGPPPGVIAYIDQRPAGWCSVAPRSSYHRLMHSRTIPKVDDLPVWSIVCFVVLPAYRRRGVMRALLRGAVAYALRSGAQAVEAYPADAHAARMNTSFAYVGTVALFKSEGFHEVQQTAAVSDRLPRILMRRIAQS